ncbi:MAG: hypothetical protein BWY63_03592 [Chloroflexi bacterium ADurb.Bin360]|nr:MAG: hypothetical protein BWY63_03592 [Chloroflexi bacterium ADurb.Bin360]
MRSEQLQHMIHRRLAQRSIIGNAINQCPLIIFQRRVSGMDLKLQRLVIQNRYHVTRRQLHQNQRKHLGGIADVERRLNHAQIWHLPRLFISLDLDGRRLIHRLGLLGACPAEGEETDQSHDRQTRTAEAKPCGCPFSGSESRRLRRGNGPTTRNHILSARRRQCQVTLGDVNGRREIRLWRKIFLGDVERKPDLPSRLIRRRIVNPTIKAFYNARVHRETGRAHQIAGHLLRFYDIGGQFNGQDKGDNLLFDG